MRRILLFAVLLSAISFVSCSSDDDDNNNAGNGNSFTWEGDWTNSKDPNYKPDYTPLLRDWINVEGGYKFYRFQRGRIDRFVYNNSSRQWERDMLAFHEINGTAFRYDAGYGMVTVEYKFIFENGTKYLMMRGQFPTGQWEKYKQRLSS